MNMQFVFCLFLHSFMLSFVSSELRHFVRHCRAAYVISVQATVMVAFVIKGVAIRFRILFPSLLGSVVSVGECGFCLRECCFYWRVLFLLESAVTVGESCFCLDSIVPRRMFPLLLQYNFVLLWDDLY